MKAISPEHTKQDIDAYVRDRLPPGDFLHAVLSNDLRESVFRADEENRAAMFDIVCYCYNNIPAECWGSRERVSNWLHPPPEQL